MAPATEPSQPADRVERMCRARRAFEGLSLGDSIGEQFFGRWRNLSGSVDQHLRKPPWRITDDSVMALSILDVLNASGEIVCSDLASAFASKYRDDPRRGYGGGAHEILLAISEGRPWQSVAKEAFDGSGSMGNGGAMRVAPLGAFFANETEARIAEQAAKSAQVTHAHPEGQAGAIAVALATAWATIHTHDLHAGGQRETKEFGRRMLSFVLNATPHGETWEGIKRARRITTESPRNAAAELGCGRRVTSPDTVPFCLWAASGNLGNYRAALRSAISVGGDIDTNCAIIGGIVSMSAEPASMPLRWKESREITSWERNARWNSASGIRKSNE